MKSNEYIPGRIKTLLLGAGLTGLSSGYHLGDNCLVVDSSTEPGGQTKTLEHNGFFFDSGLHFLNFKDPWTRKWLSEDIGVPLELKDRNSKVWIHDRLIPYPVQNHLSSLPLKYKMSYGTSAFFASLNSDHSSTDIPMSAWGIDNYGKTVTNELVRPYVEKVSGVSLEELTTSGLNGFIPKPSARNVLIDLFLGKNDQIGSKSEFWYPSHGGIGTVVECLAKKVPNIRLNLQLESLDLVNKVASFNNGVEISYEQLVSTIPLDDLVSKISPMIKEISEPAGKLKFNDVSICHIMLKRPDICKGIQYIDFPEAEIPFYRISMPQNISESNCPDGCSSISIEFGGEIDSKTEMEAKSKEILVQAGILNDTDMQAESIWCHIDHAYIVHDKNRDDSRSKILSNLRKHKVVCLGRAGRWDDTRMESALIQGREVARRLSGLNRYKSQIVRKPVVKDDPVQDYFDNRYPDRSKGISRFFRKSESARLDAVLNWLPNCEGLSILDVGCGDGVFLSQLLNGVPGFLRIEDFVESKVIEAQERLLNKTDYLEAVVSDIRDSDDSPSHDVVMAFGVFDYYKDWENLLKRLLDLTKDDGVVIVDFPKSENFHSHVRKRWLRINKVNYHSTSKQELREYLDDMQIESEIVELKLHWMIRIRKFPKTK